MLTSNVKLKPNVFIFFSEIKHPDE